MIQPYSIQEKLQYNYPSPTENKFPLFIRAMLAMLAMLMYCTYGYVFPPPLSPDA